MTAFDVGFRHLPELHAVGRSHVDLANGEVHEVVASHEMSVERDAVFQFNKLNDIAVSMVRESCCYTARDSTP